MRPHFFDIRAGSPSARLTISLGLLAAVCACVLLSGSTAGATVAQQQAELAEVRAQQDSVADRIAADNQRINAMIAEVSQARRAEQAAAEELAAKQAELETASEELEAGRKHLQEVKAELEEAIEELEGMLVGIYKSGEAQVIDVLIQSENWQDAEIDATYLSRLEQYQQDTITRVRDLRVEAAATVERLETTKQRIEDARDEIAAHEAELSQQRQALESQEAELASARASRRAVLQSLSSREGRLQRGINRALAPPEVPDGSASGDDVAAPAPAAPAPNGSTATLNSDGSASAPANAPQAVKNAIAAANAIRDMPYVWGGGHGSFEDSGYDCSGAVSYALNGGGFLSSPLDSTGLGTWGEAGAGSWITIYANSGHVYAVIAGLRWDTSGTGGSGPSWSTDVGYQNAAAFTARHPAGY